MNMGGQMLLAAIIACVIAVPIVLYKHKTYRLQGKPVKYLEIKVITAVGMPIAAIPILLSEISVKAKVITLFVMFLSGIAYVYGVNASRRAFRRIMGLPPEDEHTGGDKARQEEKP